MLTCKRNKGFIAHIDKLRSYLDALRRFILEESRRIFWKHW